MDEERVLHIDAKLAGQIKQTNQHEGVFYYAHNDQVHRIIWIFERPIEDLVGQNIRIILERNSYGGRKLTLPQFVGRTHLVVRMTDVLQHTDPDINLFEIIHASPRQQQLGRKRNIKNSIVIRASVPASTAAQLRELGKGNLSEGVRLAINRAFEKGKGGLQPAIALAALTIAF